jgi:hypothetical protein
MMYLCSALMWGAQVRFANGKPACPAREEPDYLPEAPTM